MKAMLERLKAAIRLAVKQYLCEHDWGTPYHGTRTCNKCSAVERTHL